MKQRHAGRRCQQSHCQHCREIRKKRNAAVRLRVVAAERHEQPSDRDDRDGSQRQTGRLVGVVVSFEKRFVAGGLLKRIDANRVLAGDGADESEP